MRITKFHLVLFCLNLYVFTAMFMPRRSAHITSESLTKQIIST